MSHIRNSGDPARIAAELSRSHQAQLAISAALTPPMPVLSPAGLVKRGLVDLDGRPTELGIAVGRHLIANPDLFDGDAS